MPDIETLMAVCVPPIEILVAVAVAVVTLMVQSVVLSEAETPVTKVSCAVFAGLKNVSVDVLAVPKTVAVAVPVTNTAVAVAIGTSIRYHAVPSLAIAQSRVAVAVFVIGKNRFVANAVFGVAVWLRNVTVFAEPIDHAPVNVQTRKVLPELAANLGQSSTGPRSRLPPSTFRTASAIRCAAGRVNFTKRLFPAPCAPPFDAPCDIASPYGDGGVPKYDEKEIALWTRRVISVGGFDSPGLAVTMFPPLSNGCGLLAGTLSPLSGSIT